MMATNKDDGPLRLAGEAFTEEKSWKRNREMMTSLPYLDSLNEEERRKVTALIEEELQQSSKKPEDYLAELPELPGSRLENDALMQAELGRIDRGEALEALDLERYNLETPSGAKGKEMNAWKAALENAYAQREHQRNRLVNLELMLKYAAQSHRAHNEALSSHIARVKQNLSKVEANIKEVNSERKLQQTAAGRELQDLELQYFSLVQKNKELELACRQLEENLGTNTADGITA